MSNEKASLWFEALEELGERPVMSFASVDVHTGEISWCELSHKDHDGLGGIFELASKFEIKDTQIDYKLSERRAPNFIQKIKSLIKYNPESKLRHTRWCDFERLKTGAPFRDIIFFSQDEVNQIKDNAKKMRCSAHIYMLYTVDKFVAHKLLEKDQERWWMVPVNMRTKQIKYCRENFSSYISVQINDGAKARSINLQMILKLKNYLHWAPWFWMKIVSFFGKKSVKKALSYFDENSHGWTGIFTYIDYKLIGFENYQKILVGIAPVTRAHPISFDFFPVEGHMLLGLKVHAGMLKDEVKFTEFTNNLKTYICEK